MSNRHLPSGSFVGAVSTLGAAGILWGLDARRRSQKAALVHRTMVELLLNTLCAGDPETARHSRRVAALLHDLGKLDDHVVPLVHSHRRLNERERSRMEDHPNQSAGILQPLEEIHPGISLIVESHHERWDGGGYPQGLSGPQIPLEARIISVADVFDAMTEPRAYRDPVDADEVLEILRRDAGSKFDPQVVSRVGRPDVWEGWLAVAQAGRREEAALRGREEDEEREAQADADEAPPRGAPGSATSG